MSVFVSTTYLKDKSKIQEALDELHAHNIRNIELGSNHTRTDIKSLKLYKDSQYLAHNYFPAEDPNFILNISSQNSKIRDHSIRFIKNTIKLCKKLNIGFYTIHPGFFGDVTKSKNIPKTGNFDFQFKKNASVKTRNMIINETIKIIGDLYKFADKRNVQLLVENEGSQTSSQFVIFAIPEELDLLKKEVGESLKFNFNLAHATLAGINLDDLKTFLHFYKNSLFFEVSEISGEYDSHLPIGAKGQISSLLKRYSSYFARKNLILEYRNTNIREVESSHKYVTRLLKA